MFAIQSMDNEIPNGWSHTPIEDEIIVVVESKHIDAILLHLYNLSGRRISRDNAIERDPRFTVIVGWGRYPR